MAKLTPMDLTAAQRIGRCFGLEVRDVHAMTAGSVNSNFVLTTNTEERYFARIYEEQDAQGAANEARLLRGLAAHGVPTAVPLTPAAERPEAPLIGGKPVAVYPWVRGTDLCLGSVTAAHAARLGKALATVHLATPSLEPIAAGRFDLVGLQQRLLSVHATPAVAASVVADAERIASELTSVAAARDPGLPTGIIHGDLFRDNVLWEGLELTALLDFESACRGVFIYDLMVCVLAWCYRDSFELDLVRALVDGYESVRPLSAQERASAITEGQMACLRFATTRITDFEMRAPPGVPPVRDYRRFSRRSHDLQAGALDSVFGARFSNSSPINSSTVQLATETKP